MITITTSDLIQRWEQVRSHPRSKVWDQGQRQVCNSVQGLVVNGVFNQIWRRVVDRIQNRIQNQVEIGN